MMRLNKGGNFVLTLGNKATNLGELEGGESHLTAKSHKLL